MIYDPELYRRAVFPQVKFWLESRPDSEPHTQLSALALATSCPILVVAQFIGEIAGFSNELNATIERLKEFYR